MAWARLIIQLILAILPAFLSKKKQIEADDVLEATAREKEVKSSVDNSTLSDVIDTTNRMRKKP
jgi:hypothetical protein